MEKFRAGFQVASRVFSRVYAAIPPPSICSPWEGLVVGGKLHERLHNVPGLSYTEIPIRVDRSQGRLICQESRPDLSRGIERLLSLSFPSPNRFPSNYLPLSRKKEYFKRSIGDSSFNLHLQYIIRNYP